MRKIRYIFTITILVIFGFQALSQSLNSGNFSLKDESQLNVHRFDIDKGLPTPRINRILQNKKGYIWMTSYDGIIRFDGSKFDLHDSYTDTALTGNSFYALCEDKEGTLWISSSQDGLVAYKDHTFFSYGKDEGINMLYELVFADSKGRIWSGTSGKGCFFFEKGKFVFPFKDKEFNSTEIMSIEEDQDGSLYFGSYGMGLYKYFEEEFIKFGPDDGFHSKVITSLHRKENLLYIGTDNGVFVYNGFKFKHINDSKHKTVYKIFENINGKLFYTTSSGFYQIVEEEKIEVTTSRLLLKDKFYDGIFDLDGTIWLTHYDNGIYSIKESSFINVSTEHGLPGKVVNALCELHDGKILIGFDNGKIIIIDKYKISEFGNDFGLENSRIRHILQDSRRNIWISTYKGLLKVYPSGRKKWFNNSTGFPATKIRLTYEDSKNDIWIGTRDKGLLKLINGEQLDEKGLNYDFEAGPIMSIEEVGNRLLVGTAGKGLVIFSGEEMINKFDIENHLLSNVVFNTYTDKDNNIWVAGNGGLCRIKGENVFQYTENNGFKAHAPFDVVEDHSGMFWIPYNRGIISVSRKQLNEFAEGIIDEVHFSMFDNEEGIRSEGLNASTQTLINKEGRLFFPTKYGFATVNPKSLSDNITSPIVYIEEFSYNDGNFNLNDTIQITEGRFRYTFKFTAIDFISPEKIRFRYKLTGFDNDWIYLKSNIREISYTHLPAGDYEFKVSACNKSGIWNEKGAKIRFTVVPKWYNTLFFRMIMSLMIILFIYALYRFRINRLKKNEKNLEEKVKDRTNELSSALELVRNQKDEIETQKEELHDVNRMKDKLFSIIAHDLKAPFGSVLNLTGSLRGNISNYDPEQTESFIDMIHQSVEKGFSLLENLLDWAKFQLGKSIFSPEVILISPLITDIIKLLNQNADNKSISVKYDIDDNLEIYADENMFNTIIRNLFSNAIKYTNRNGKIEIRAVKDIDKVKLCVIDNGVGIKREDINKILDNKNNFSTYGTENEKGTGLGVSLIKEFIGLNSGKLFIESEEGKGSKFCVTFNIKPEEKT